MSVELEGVVEKVSYFNEETGFVVLRLRVDSEPGPVTAVGRLPSPAQGEALIMKGEWVDHPRFGRQFSVESFQTRMPETAEGAARYLASGLVKGVGPVLAERIVKAFGERTLEIIDSQPERLLEVKGVGRKNLARIKSSWAKKSGSRKVMVFLGEQGLGPGQSGKIFDKYGENAIEMVRRNPYRLADDLPGIGFRTADRVAGKLGFGHDSPERVRAGLIYELKNLADDGHVHYPLGPLIDKCRESLAVRRPEVEAAVEAAAKAGQIVVELFKGEPEKNRRVYLSGLYQAETAVAKRLKELMEAPRSIRPIDADGAVAWVRRRLDLRLGRLQIEAVRRAADGKILVLTGGPGTGKTTLIRAILAIFERLGVRIMLTAPTGRAAKRMAETSGFEAKTIHRLLEFNPLTGGFKKNAAAPLECDLLIVDEASMLDVYLTRDLFEALPLGAVVILSGDADQLPSVGPGAVLRDVIDSGVIPTVRLTEIYRQAGQSSIVVNAHRINQGLRPSLRPQKGMIEDFFFIERSTPEETADLIVEAASRRLPQKYGLDPVRDIQVLSPMNRGPAGVSELNRLLQEALNPGRPALTRSGLELRIGDKVMQTRNNYEKEVFNGDLGLLTRVDQEKGTAVVTFEDREVEYGFPELDEIVPAYAVSVHKSQGSEYPAVILPVLSRHFVLLSRNLIYTAVTRGKGLVVMVGSVKALDTALGRQGLRRRRTVLAPRLKDLFESG